MVSGGPTWIGSKKFDVIAKSGRNTKNEGTKLMMQALLADRFQLKIHTEPKPMPVFIMTAGKKVLMKESTGEDSDCKGEPAEDNKARVKCTNMTTKAIAEQLHHMAGGDLHTPGGSITG